MVQLDYRRTLHTLLAAWSADLVCRAWGAAHIDLRIDFSSFFGGSWTTQATFLLLILLTGTMSAAAARTYFLLRQVIVTWLKPLSTWLRPVVGGCLVIFLAQVVGTDYLGLGVQGNPQSIKAISIQTCMLLGGATWFSWLWKILFTAVSVGSGFKGGEVTSLFFVGAAMGNAIASATGDCFEGTAVGLTAWLAAIGLSAVLSAASKTPLACTIMAVELFQPFSSVALFAQFIVVVSICCWVASLLGGPSGLFEIRADRSSTQPSGSQPKAKAIGSQ
jgi:H+/Cl- antiporter ClcA